MTAIAPNVTIMLGELVGARLISHAGNSLNYICDRYLCMILSDILFYSFALYYVLFSHDQRGY